MRKPVLTSDIACSNATSWLDCDMTSTSSSVFAKTAIWNDMWICPDSVQLCV